MSQRALDRLHEATKEVEQAIIQGESLKHISNLCLDLADSLPQLLAQDQPDHHQEPAPILLCRRCKKHQKTRRTPGSGPHKNALRCIECDTHLCWEGKR